MGLIYGLDTVKQVQDWISTGDTSNHHPQEHGNCRTTQDFSCVKIDYDQKLTIELEDFLKNKYVGSNVDAVESQEMLFQINKVRYHIRSLAPRP